MDLTPGQQRLVFVVIVFALIGLGIYLIIGRNSGSTPAASPSPRSAQTSPGGAASGVPPATVPPPTPVSTVGGAEIYQWLPFTPADLATAASTTTTFAKDYATWSYTEGAAAYTAKMGGLVTPQEAGILKTSYSTAGQAALRTQQKQVSTGSGTIDTIRAFGTGPTSITFTVTISQQVTSTQPSKTTSDQYAVTVVSGASGWQVNDIELSNLGNP